ncbi:MAG: DAK2 domain-containing protein [Chloroflexota bacterium]
MEERGRAAVGDKTLLDALAPAAEAAGRAASAGASFTQTLAASAEAARAGADATRAMRPKVGRASWMADRSAGHEDAGAHLVALLLTSASRHARP